jgi:hypothetical protein
MSVCSALGQMSVIILEPLGENSGPRLSGASGPGLCTQTRHSPAIIAKHTVFTYILCSGLWVSAVSFKKNKYLFFFYGNNTNPQTRAQDVCKDNTFCNIRG